MKQKALQIFLAGVNNVLPDKLIRTKLLSESYIISKAEKIYVFAIGKAAFLMVKGVNDLVKIDAAQKEIDILLLQDIYKSMEWAFHFNAGNGEEIDPFDSALMMQQMFKGKK